MRIVCRCPPYCRVTACASMAEISEDMVRVLPILEIGLVTRITISRCRDISGSMAGNAGDGRMFSSQWERRCTMVERRRSPATH
jgi:hypothetical protein